MHAYNILFYIVFSILDAHAKESSRDKDGKKATINNGWIKDRLQDYVNLFPPVLVHLAEHRHVCSIGCGMYPSLAFKQLVVKYGEHEAGLVTSADDRRVAAAVFKQVNAWLSLKRVTSPVVRRFVDYFKEQVCTRNEHVCSSICWHGRIN